MIRVAAYTGGASVPSARFRVRQLIPDLREHGVEVFEYPAAFGSYPPINRVLRPAWGVAALVERTVAVRSGRYADVTLLQREMLSTLRTVEFLTRRPRILDMDDAIWLHSPSRMAALARDVDMVVGGNSYLAEWASQVNPHTAIVPTGVDVDVYTPAESNTSGPLIGWCGTSSGHPYLLSIEEALASALAAVPEARVRVVSDRRPMFTRLPADRIEFVAWSPENEVPLLQDLSIGIMPLADTAWARGKCSFKMLTYMACGVAVVASDVGMNADVFRRGACGVPVRSTQEWSDALVHLLRHDAERRAMGREGRRIVEVDFSTRETSAALARVIKDVAGR